MFVKSAVWHCSRSGPMVVLEQSTKPMPTLDLAGDSFDVSIGMNQLVGQPLMISLGVVMLDVLPNCILK